MLDDAGPLPLNPQEQRVLGALLEKQVTVPGSYPLSLNALRAACNQSSSREPVVEYDDNLIDEIVRELRHRDLIRFVWSGKGARTVKFHQRLEEQLDLTGDDRALITVLLLRGPQAPGELKTRTERLHPFTDRSEVEACLRRMADRSPALVEELPLRPGQQDRRWIHLLGPVPATPDGIATIAAPAVNREQVIAHGTAARDDRVRASYDAVAAAYAEHVGDELGAKPFDRWLLTRIADLAAGRPVVDLGCGPGHVTAFLAEAGADVTGIDLSPAMVEQARRRHPGERFEVGHLDRVLRPPAAAAWGAMVAFYSLIHLAASELPTTLAALGRVLSPGGWLVLAVHAGAEVRHTSSWWDVDVDLEVVFHDPAEVRAAVAHAGLEVVEWYLRGPLAGAEVASERLYVLARRPA